MQTGVIINEDSYVYDPEFVNEKHEDFRFRHLQPATRQEAYAPILLMAPTMNLALIIYATTWSREVDQLRQRDLHFAIVDEVDSILIDEARTPLIISAPDDRQRLHAICESRPATAKRQDFEIDEKHKTVILTDKGVENIEKILGIDNLYGTENIRTIYHLDQAVRGPGNFSPRQRLRGTNEGEIVIVDEFTGRLLKGRRYNEGLHQAIEAKEGVEVQQESP